MRSLLRSAGLVLILSAGMCPDKGPDFLGPSLNSPQFGNLAGTVLSGSTPLVGANVALSGTPPKSMITPSNGTFNFDGLNLGQYTITTTLNNYICPSANAMIELDKTTSVNVQCTPVPGSVTGTVRVNGTGQAGVVVFLVGATQVSVSTDATGKYTFSNIAPGAYTVNITPPGNTTCSTSQAVTVNSGQAATADFACTIQTGSISGTVTINGQPAFGVSVRAVNGTNNVTVTSGLDGTFSFPNLATGTYAVTVDPGAGISCSTTTQTATVTASQNTVVNFSCSTQPGTVSGQVSGLPSGETATLTLKTSDNVTVTTVTTNSSGAYSISNVAPGAYSVFITAPTTATCSPASVAVSVQSNQNATANFSCVPFVVALTGSYRHVVVGVSSETCVKITTSAPLQAGASWSVTWSGPGVVPPGARSGTTDSNGEAFDRQTINLIGTYTATVTVTKGGVTVVKTVDVPVSAAAGTCPAPGP